MRNNDFYSDQARINGSYPYTKFVRSCLLEGLERGASDIHIEPSESGLQIRNRVDGDLEVFRRVDLKHQKSLIYEAKRVFGLPVSDTLRPADSSSYFPEWKLKVRANKKPNSYGEKIVLRLIRLGQEFDLNSWGYSPKVLNTFKKAISHKNGVIIIAGSTGSGKSTALSCLLSALNTEKRNISTLEDPIESEIPGVNHSKVDSNMSFADGLRALLRQDPDVIMVGEIRDPETAELCFQAANTGHLVLSTLHANDVQSVITRLKSLGVDEDLIKPNLRFVASQSLERALCQKCSLPASKELIEMASSVVQIRKPGFWKRTKYRVTNTKGCEECRFGERGRIPVNECLIDPYGDSQLISSKESMRFFCEQGKLSLEKVLL